MITTYLADGAVGGTIIALFAFALSRLVHDMLGRLLLAGFLITAAGNYVRFAAETGMSTGWLITEVVGVAAFGALAVLGLRSSPMWLALGWALHPVWDLGLHRIGPGHFAPEEYPISCLSYDLIVAAVILITYRLGLVGRRSEHVLAAT